MGSNSYVSLTMFTLKASAKKNVVIQVVGELMITVNMFLRDLF